MRKLSDNLKIIQKFVATENKPHPSFYGREGKLAKNLIEKYNVEFLLWVPLPDNKKINSLLWLSCTEGIKYLNAYIMDFKSSKTDLTQKPQEVKLNQEKFGEDVIIEHKPKTLIDFLNKYK